VYTLRNEAALSASGRAIVQDYISYVIFLTFIRLFVKYTQITYEYNIYLSKGLNIHKHT
jgi:hypothetical protein